MTLIDPELHIGSGRMRDCYIHPDRPDRIIKIQRADCPEHLDPKRAEWNHWQDIRDRHGELPMISACCGMVETSLGQGLVMACIRDADGSLSSPLSSVFEEPEAWDLSEVRLKVELFLAFIVWRNIRLFDLNPGNILLRKDEQQTVRPVAIDLKGPFDNHETLPISSWFPWFSRRKLIRRSKRLLDLIDEKAFKKAA
ncbi:YrbL family protein [Desulfobotulus mexicanus]|nr:YrbL family protein [Desulfobotulus mexicanus]